MGYQYDINGARFGNRSDHRVYGHRIQKICLNDPNLGLGTANSEIHRHPFNAPGITAYQCQVYWHLL